ncbi:hypothetical protein NDR87_13595 [Nocardia sp. CDC159]|uniref:Uncharacterized protein n=1 Tax=Nocardia pulmonis TaxID=2951408 RepID=A0A9X2E5L1_9NOCA|nr:MULTISPECIES: hypothetical protein [Nocardia]MCM6774542.1 hypothetical protein [Nocardia pulmonis]MCM6787392.1 hypothetical protein [Nocardia sp. CDC159]
MNGRDPPRAPHELARKPAIDAAEHDVRTRLAVVDRTLSSLICAGPHLSVPVVCPFVAISTS